MISSTNGIISNISSTIEPPPLSIRDVIFAPAEYFKQIVSIGGTIVLLDVDLGRMDISSGGAKIMVDISQIEKHSLDILQVLVEVIVTGYVKKQQRRTFFSAISVEIE